MREKKKIAFSHQLLILFWNFKVIWYCMNQRKKGSELTATLIKITEIDLQNNGFIVLYSH